MKPFAYEAPDSFERAIQLLVEQDGQALPLAGGTDLLVRVKSGSLNPGMLVDLAGLDDLKGIELTDPGLRLGSLVTHTDIIESELVRENVPVLALASASVGAVQTRNLGSLGGNLASGVPSMDSAPALLVLGARVVIFGPEGRADIPLEQLFDKPHQTTLRPGQLIKDILIPRENLGKPASFAKFGRRKAMSLALVNAAAAFRLDGPGRIRAPRVALGAVAATPLRALAAEACLEGQRPGEEIFRQAATLAAREASPISDLRASADYRRRLVEVLVGRVLTETAARAEPGE